MKNPFCNTLKLNPIVSIVYHKRMSPRHSTLVLAILTIFYFYQKKKLIYDLENIIALIDHISPSRKIFHNLFCRITTSQFNLAFFQCLRVWNYL